MPFQYQFVNRLPQLIAMVFFRAFFVVFATVLLQATATQVLFPPGLPELNTPVITNGFVGGPTEFAVVANISFQKTGCAPYSAPGMIAVVPIAPCTRSIQYQLAIEAGALGLVYCDFEEVAIGRRSRAPISDTPLDIPAVVISTPDYFMLLEVAKTAPFITLEITPGVSEWHQTVGITGWFITVNILFGLFYLSLLALVLYKFVRKIKATGFMWNISFVYLFFQAIFCILMIVRWLDPMLTWGFYSTYADAFIDTWPATWSFAALVLMAFFWFEVINQFADTKVKAFLSKKMQIPFWIFVGIIILLPAINSILLNHLSIVDLFIALLAISFAAGMIVACFYIIVAVKALQVINRSARLNVDKKSRVRGLARSRVSIIISTIIACIYPPCNFIMRYYILKSSMYFGLAVLYEESLLLGLITFIQVWFMPNKPPGASSTTGKSSRTRNSVYVAKEENTTTTRSEAKDSVLAV
jgi:ABC-type uncharacterized transport system fused permease/ATPase subunit